MSLYDVLVFVHIAVLVLAFVLTGAIHTSEWLTARAATVQEMRVLAKPQKWGVLFGPVVALMLLIGGWLVKLSEDRAAEFSFSDGWVWTGAVVLLIAFASGIGIHTPHGEKLGKALGQAAEGPATPELKALAADTVAWVVGYVVPFMILAVASNMVNKPGTAVSILVIAVGAVLGAVLGFLLVQRARA